jgi:hypothetical protein
MFMKQKKVKNGQKEVKNLLYFLNILKYQVFKVDKSGQKILKIVY